MDDRFRVPKLTIKPYEDRGGQPLTLAHLDVRLDDVPVKGLRGLTLSAENNEANTVVLDIMVGDLDIDVEALQEIEANIEARDG